MRDAPKASEYITLVSPRASRYCFVVAVGERVEGYRQLAPVTYLGTSQETVLAGHVATILRACDGVLQRSAAVIHIHECELVHIDAHI
jgi:hypothetical protein